jgi:FkbM family methyltransferase
MKQLVQSLLKLFGLRLARLANTNTPSFGTSVLFGTLQRYGFSPRLVLDIGANRGNWTRSALQYFPEADYFLVEPQSHLKVYSKDLLESGRVHWINAGAADQSGQMCFYVVDRDDSSSFLPGQITGRVGRKTEVEVLTIDDLIQSYDLPTPDMVKIDAEGFDLKVLRGATSLIGKTDVFLLEAAAACPFENTIGCVISTMDNLGYRIMDITEINRSPKYGVLWLTELVFLRKSSSLLSAVTSYE